MCIMERRKRTWPVTYLIGKPTKEHPHGTSQMFYAHEWEAYQKSLPPEDRDPEFADRTEPTPEPATVSGEGYSVPSEARGAAPDEGYGVPSKARGTARGEGYGVPSKARGAISSAPSRPPDFARHSLRCTICSHPDRDAIEADFIRWRSPELIARAYKIPDRSSIYRHAHSTGLFAWRKQELGRTLESILECAEQIPLESADIIIRAARIYSRLDDHGKWFEPPRTTHLLTGPAPALHPLESTLPTNSARTRKRSSKKTPRGEEKVNRNIHQIEKSVNPKNRKEKAKSYPQQIRRFWKRLTSTKGERT
jgi:hypothetical protein